MTCLEHSKLNTKDVIISLPKIVACLILVKPSTWHSCVAIFVDLDCGRYKINFTLWSVLILLACIFYFFTAYFLIFSFDIIFTITVFNYSIIFKNDKLFFTPAFIYTYSYDRVIMRFYIFSRLEGCSISCSKIHYNIPFSLLLSCIS